MTDFEQISESWKQFEKDGSLRDHMDRCLHPRSPWPRPVRWGLVAWFSFLGALGLLLGVWLVA